MHRIASELSRASLLSLLSAPSSLLPPRSPLEGPSPPRCSQILLPHQREQLLLSAGAPCFLFRDGILQSQERTPSIRPDRYRASASDRHSDITISSSAAPDFEPPLPFPTTRRSESASKVITDSDTRFQERGDHGLEAEESRGPAPNERISCQRNRELHKTITLPSCRQLAALPGNAVSHCSRCALSGKYSSGMLRNKPEFAARGFYMKR